MNRDRLVKTFQELTAIDAPSFDERKMADELTARLRKLGFVVSEDRAGEYYGGTAGNLYASRQGNIPGKPLLFSTHMDTVEPSRGKKAVLHEDGRITSDGTTVLGADCMAGTAAILEALTELYEEQACCRDLELLFFIGEEKHLKGSAVFDFTKVQAEESYILDLSGPLGTAAVQAPTLIDFSITVHGKAAHAGFAPEQGVHSIKIAAEAMTRIELGRVGDSMTVNIGYIEGGVKATNIVPECCRLLGEIRSYSHEQALGEMKRIEKIFQEEAEKAGGSCEADFTVPIQAYRVQETHPCVRRFRRACERLKFPVRLVPPFGGSDQSNLARHGISGLVLASAMEQVHSCAEYTTVSGLETVTELVKLLMQDAE